VDTGAGIERSLGKVEAKLDGLDTKIDAKFETFISSLHDLDVRLAVVEHTSVTPKKLLWVLLSVASFGSIMFGVAVTIGDRLWGS
jgi:hypothetical protein